MMTQEKLRWQYHEKLEKSLFRLQRSICEKSLDQLGNEEYSAEVCMELAWKKHKRLHHSTL